MFYHAVGTSPMRQQTMQTAFQEDMRSLLTSTENADINFLLNHQPHPIPAHSSVVAIRCYNLRNTILRFRKKFINLPEHCTHSVLELPVHVSSEISFYKVLEYVYTGSITLEATDVFDVCSLATYLGIPSLQSIVFSYLRNDENLALVTTVLDRALQNLDENRHLVIKLTEHFAENASKALRRAPFSQLSRNLMEHLAKQENLAASELEIWDALITWSCARARIVPAKKVSEMRNSERHLIANYMRTFYRPGMVRILNFDAVSFAEEVEPLGVFTMSDILLKYRFDAIAGKVAFEDAFPKDRYNFLLRIRQRTMCFESDSHPHPRGVSQTAKVELPKWVSEMKVEFDQRTALGRYADLEFFMNEDLTRSIFSVRASTHNQFDLSSKLTRSEGYSRKLTTLRPLSIAGNRFWYTFYAPQNVGDLAWGYKFQVSIIR